MRRPNWSQGFLQQVGVRSTNPTPEVPIKFNGSKLGASNFAIEGSHKETLIKHGDSVIFSEPALYEGYKRFVEVAEILHTRYGTALRDLIPTAASKLYLHGDYSGSSRVVAAVRERIFSISAKGDA